MPSGVSNIRPPSVATGSTQIGASQKGFIKITMIILLILMGGVGIYHFCRSAQKNKVKENCFGPKKNVLDCVGSFGKSGAETALKMAPVAKACATGSPALCGAAILGSFI